MSRYHRRNDIWPADNLAVHVWHLVAALEEVADLAEASKSVEAAEAKATVIKKALVELKSFDDLISEFQVTLRVDTGLQLTDAERAALESGLRAYHQAVQPERKLLAEIRNTIAAHRRSLRGNQQRERFAKNFQAWGEWEQTLVRLEQQCTLERWLKVINAAVAFRNVVAETSPGSWFSITGNGAIRMFVPLKTDLDGTSGSTG